MEERRLKEGTVITATHPSGATWTIDHNDVFTDTPESGSPIYNSAGEKLFFLKDHIILMGCGFSEKIF